MNNMKPINLKGLERYLITEDGQVWSRNKKRWLKPYQNNCGYIYYSFTVTEDNYKLFKNHSPKFSAHRLVAFTYKGNPPTEHHEVNHIDGNKGNNYYKNLEWVTHSENILNGYRYQGRKSYWKGKNKPSPGLETRMKMADAKKRGIEMYRDGIKVGEFGSIKEACEGGKFERQGIYRNISGKRKDYKGHIFKFVQEIKG